MSIRLYGVLVSLLVLITATVAWRQGETSTRARMDGQNGVEAPAPRRPAIPESIVVPDRPRITNWVMRTAFTVTTAADNLDNNNPTPGSLRARIRLANLNPGPDLIDFAIAGVGPHVINAGGGLPVITDTLTIDGYTQSGASANTLADGNNASLKIEILGHAPSQGTGLVIAANDCVIKGLAIHGFSSAILIDGARSINGASRNTIAGNFIGTNINGTASGADFANGTGNLGNGVYIDGGGFKPDNSPGTANANIVGGTTPAARNVISGNGANGVRISKALASATAGANLVQGNYIGTTAAGAAALGNGDGVFVTTVGNTIGGTAAGSRNIISGNNYSTLTSKGVNLCCGAADNLIQGNFIGTDVTGTFALPNGVHGVVAGNNAHNNLIGGAAPEARNIISGNPVVGVALGNASSGNKIQGNYIGTNATGTMPLANGFMGVNVTGATSAMIGGALPGEGNLISANTNGGVDIAADNTIVQGNFIGTQVDGLSPLGNPQYGVRVSGTANQIGGRAAGMGNVIAFNTIGASDLGSAVIVAGGLGMTIVGNSIYSNDGLGIDLARNGVTANDACDADSAATNNGLQNYPVLNTVSSGAGVTTIQGTLGSKALTSYTLDFYSNAACDPSGFGEGQTYLGSATVITDANCTTTYTATLPLTIPAGRFMTATATDPGGSTSEFSACVAVTLANSSPDAVNDTASTNEDNAAAINVLANDTDADGHVLSITSFTQGSNGAVTSGPGISLTYTPNPNFNGLDSFTYAISDGNGGTDTATVNITVNAVNDPPDAVNDTASTNEDTPVTVSVRSNDANGDCGAIMITAVTQGANGAVVINPDGTLRYTPRSNFHGRDTFRYTIGCGQGNRFTALERSVLSLLAMPANAVVENVDEAEVAVNVIPVNDPPDAVNDAATTDENTAVTIDVLANDTDVENNALTVTSFTQGANGSVAAGPGGTLRYTPNAGFSGADPFTYTLSDGNGGMDTATVTVTVNAVSSPPDAVDDAATTNEDSPKSINARANDSNGNCGTVSLNGFTQPANGSVIHFVSNGTFLYTPAPNFNGTDSFTYTLRCARGDTDTATITVNVTPVNDTPSATNDSYATDEDIALIIAAPGVLSNDTDVESGPLAAALVSGPTRGTLTLNPNGSFTFMPPLNYSGTATFVYRASDGDGASATATVTISVAPVNDPPIARDDTLTATEDSYRTVEVLLNDTDPEGETLTLQAVTLPGNGRILAFSTVSNPTGRITYSPNANYNGPDSFTYTVRDSNGNTSTANVVVTVTPVNDAPVAVDDEYTVGASGVLTVNAPGVLLNDSDIDGDTLTAVLFTAPTRGTLSLNADGSFTYTAGASFGGCDSFEYRNRDGALFSNIVTVSLRSAVVSDPLAERLLALKEDPWGIIANDYATKIDAPGGRISQTVAPIWTKTDNLGSNRVMHSATLLSDGKVLVVGGTRHAPRDFFTATSFLRTAEIYDPALGTWRGTGDMQAARGNHTATLLANGKVLVAGGFGENGVPLGTSEIFDPATGAWTRTAGNLSTSRAHHTASVLSNGKILIVGGVGTGNSILNSTEIFDPATLLWTRARTLGTGRWAHTETFLPGGKVLIAGGYGAPGSTIQNTAELYDAAADTWTRTGGNLGVARSHHTATRLLNGKVLLAGGLGPTGMMSRAEIYHPATETFTATGVPLNTGRWLHTATLLRNGNVMVAGGNTDDNFGQSATGVTETYDPATDSWAATGQLHARRHSQTATLLHNNKVLATGGMHAAATLKSAELYDTFDTRPLFSTCSAVTVTRLHGEGFHGNSRIARIENGRVPCVHSETAAASECQFSTTGTSASMMWLEAVDGQYAKTGQSITPQGAPGGEWIVAARVNPNGTVPCVAPSGNDTAGLIAEGDSLAQVCVVEDLNTEYNALFAYGWHPLENFADLEVCSANIPGTHPDNAFLTRTIASCNGLVGCYRYTGAALNDPNGAERDSSGVYFTEPEYCHFARVNGVYEIPAAKRPATFSLPAPGRVNINTGIMWRPVSPNFNLANDFRLPPALP